MILRSRSVPRFVLLRRLFFLRVLLVAAPSDQRAGQHTGIGFDHNALWVPCLNSGDGDTRVPQPGRALEEHQPDRRAVELLRADRACRNIRRAAVFLIAIGRLSR